MTANVESKFFEQKAYVALINHAHKTLPIFSRWLLGGALAAVAAILLNPDSYNLYYGIAGKIAFVLLMLSILSGLIHHLFSQVIFVIYESEKLKTLISTYPTDMGTFELEQEMDPSVFHEIKFLLVKFLVKRFEGVFYQIIFFTLGILILTGYYIAG